MKNKILLLAGFLLSLLSCTNKGKKVPEFNLNTIDGKRISEKDLINKITVIDVWATWCPNCINELPGLNLLVEKYKNDSTILFLAVSDETEERINLFLKKRPFNFTQIPNGKLLTDALQTRLIKTFPQVVIIGKSLDIEFDQSGEIKNIAEVLSNEIEKLR